MKEQIEINIKEEIAADGSLSGVEEEESEAPFPFDAEKISISSKTIPIETLLRRIKQGTISSPEIQRKEGVWSIEQQSRLIESLMLRIPLPMFYVSADENEHWKIVDGLQRITAIKNFLYIEKPKKLKGLEFLSKFEGHTFNKLSPLYQNRILETEFQFAIIAPSTPENVQRNIFKRLNTGGLPLTAQEIRHALYYGKSTQFLKNLVELKEFKKATSNSINDSRMAGQELILRFLAFYLNGYENYPKNADMDSFLCNTMKEINKINTKDFVQLNYTDLNEITEKFIVAMLRANNLFNNGAFRKSTGLINQRRSPVNKSLFEVWSCVLANLSEADYTILQQKQNELMNIMHNLMYSDKTFSSAISQTSHQFSSVMYRFDVINKIVADLTRG